MERTLCMSSLVFKVQPNEYENWISRAPSPIQWTINGDTNSNWRFDFGRAVKRRECKQARVNHVRQTQEVVSSSFFICANSDIESTVQSKVRALLNWVCDPLELLWRKAKGILDFLFRTDFTGDRMASAPASHVSHISRNSHRRMPKNVWMGVKPHNYVNS